MPRQVDVAIIGAGTAGLAAMAQVRRKTDNFVLINGGELGTTCARVGCMPSKVAIQVAEDFHRRHLFDREGITGHSELSMDVPEAMEHVRDLRDIFVDRVLEGTTDTMGDDFVDGYARFLEPDLLQVADQEIRAKSIVIATGSRPIVPTAWRAFGDRILTTDNLFEQETLPKSLAVIGLGVVGLEMGQAFKRMGVAVYGFDQRETVSGLTDPVVNRLAIDIIGKEVPLYLGAPAEIEETDTGLRIGAGEHEVVVDKVLAAMGRAANVDKLGLEDLGIPVNEYGIPRYNPNTMQVADLPIFIAGDVTADQAILHVASEEGRIAGLNAVADEITAYRRKTNLAINFCDPNIAVVGTPFDQLNPDSSAIGEMRLGPVGRALVMGKNKGIVRVYADKQSGRLLGGAILAARGEHLAHVLALAVQQELTVLALLEQAFYHPSMEEALEAALKNLAGKLETPSSQPLAG